MNIKKLTDLNVEKKRVLIREDLNVPLEDGRITSDQRIRAALPALQYALKQQAAVIVMSHLGRPKEGEYDPALSLAPVAKGLSELLHQAVPLIKEWQNGIAVKPGEIVLLEHIRFNKGEKNNDVTLSKKLAALCDVFVMDAFATAHRAEASTCGVAEYASIACAGPLLTAELEALSRAFYQPKKPLVAIVGGSKVSTKLTVLESLLQKVDQLIVGGGIVNTFLKAQGFNIGKSLCEMELIDTAKRLQQLAKERNAAIPMPVDVVVAKEFSKTAKATIKSAEMVADDEMILDIGPETARQFADYLKNAGTIIWNGPVGVFEWDQFGEGTKTLAQAIAHSSAFSLAGGGDTLAAIDKYNIQKQLSYISTGGGAFLEFLEGKELPAVAVLQRRNSTC